MKKFILYIVFVLSCFNSLICFANEDVFSSQNTTKQEYIIRDFSKKNEKNKQEELVKTNNSYGLFLVLPFIVDKLYEGDQINNDITPFLKQLYPSNSEKSLEILGDAIKSFVLIKREYTKLLNKFEYAIKAKKILPKDAPIIAKKGEYIEEDEIITPTSSPDEYKITNNLRKYLEYDKGALGEPVRMRDKNYIPSPDVDELTLAILNFDIRKIKESIEKMPKYNDGSAEKPYIGPHDLRARILLDTSRPGDRKTILGAIDIRIPDGYYINGDILNKNAKIIFNLKEIEDEDLNIKDYQFFKPLANGFEKDGISRRVLLNRVSFPFIVNRKDTNKKLIINGDLFFELCKIDGGCEQIKTEHALTLKPSLDENISIYYNHVTQAHAKLPQEELKFAKINNVIYDVNNKTLKVFIKHKKDISNIAVMVEDEKYTNFLNPRYEINNDESVAIFDVAFINKNHQLNDLGISVSLNDKYFFRNVVKPSITDKIERKYELSLFDFFLLGLVTLFSPGVFYLVIKLMRLLMIKDEKRKIFTRYVLSFIVSLLIFIDLLSNNFENRYIYFIICAILVEGSLLFSILGYMDFSLFRPFRKILKHGYILGIFTSLLFLAFPLIGKSFVFDVLSIDNITDKTLCLFSFATGMLSPLVVYLLLQLKKKQLYLEFKALNALFGVFYLVCCFYFIWYTNYVSVLYVVIVALLLLLIVWYHYPILITKFTKGKTLSKANIVTFNKIQNFTFLIIFTLFMVTFVLVSYLPQKQISNPSVEETWSVINSQLEKNRPVLVAVNTTWDFASIFNSIILKKVEKKGLTIAYINNYIPTPEGSYWIKKYNTSISNVYILFSNRHKNGIVLPKILNGIDFDYTVKNFN